MSIDDCQNVVKKLVGINFPNRVDGLREGNRYWKEYDDFNRLKATYMLVAEAYKGEWCPIASKLVDGKLDPTFRPIKRNRTSPSFKWKAPHLSLASSQHDRIPSAHHQVLELIEQATHSITQRTSHHPHHLPMHLGLLRQNLDPNHANDDRGRARERRGRMSKYRCLLCSRTVWCEIRRGKGVLVDVGH